MFNASEQIGGFFGFKRSYVATPLVAIERAEFARSELTEAIAWLRSWRTRRGDKARAVEMIVMAEPRHENAAKEWIDAFLREQLVVELAAKFPVEITFMDDGAALVERYKAAPTRPPQH